MSKMSGRNIYISEAVVWLEAAAAFMPLSFMVNGSVVNLETQCLPGKSKSTLNVKDRMSNFEIQQTLSLKKQNKTIVNINSYCKTIKTKKKGFNWNSRVLCCLVYISDREKETQKQGEQTKNDQKREKLI